MIDQGTRTPIDRQPAEQQEGDSSPGGRRETHAEDTDRHAQKTQATGEGAAGCSASNHRGNANEKRFVTMNSTRFSLGQCREGLGKDLPPPFLSITSPQVLRIKTGIILARVQEMFTRALLVDQNIKFNATNGH